MNAPSEPNENKRQAVDFDASAVLAWLLDERGGELVEQALPGMTSAVNVAEVASVAIARGLSREEVRTALQALSPDAVPFNVDQAYVAASIHARTRSLGFSLSDCACLSLASQQNATAITSDRAWAGADLSISITVIR